MALRATEPAKDALRRISGINNLRRVFRGAEVLFVVMLLQIRQPFFDMLLVPLAPKAIGFEELVL